MRHPLATVITVVACLLAVIAFAQEEQEASTPPLASDLQEQVESRIVQIDVSVIDRRKSQRRSVPGLRKEMFELHLDGRRLTEEQYARAAFDQVCGEGVEAIPAELRQRYMVVMLDFNHFDAEMRLQTIEALRSLADRYMTGEVWVKVVGYRRSVDVIQAFTREPEDIRHAAALLESPGLFPTSRGQAEQPGPHFEPGRTELTQYDDFGPRAGSDPWTVHSSEAFADVWNGTLGGFFDTGLSTASLFGDDSESAYGSRYLVEAHWDPRASLGAVESVLRAHATLPGRKALVLFTGESWYLSNVDLEMFSTRMFEASQEGFTVWVVDSKGFSGDGALRSYRSDLLGALAGRTGGETLRSAPDIAAIFPRALEALSCYYLFSVPVSVEKRGRKLSISVRLNKAHFPELWRYSVRHRTQVRLHDRATEQELFLTTALLNPEAFQSGPPLRADLSFPVNGNGPIPVEVSVPLSALRFQATESGVAAEFRLDAVVERNGLSTVCTIPENRGLRVYRIHLADDPGPDARGSLVIRHLCPFRGPGRYTVRAAISEPGHRWAGATRSMAHIRPGAHRELTLSGIRVGRNTGQDYLLAGADRDIATVPRDDRRSAFVPVAPGQTADVGDRHVFRYVLCGPSREEAKSAVYRAVFEREREGDGGRMLFILPGSGDPLEDGTAGVSEFEPDPFCAEIEDALPPGGLDPGRYGFAVFRLSAGQPVRRSVLESALTDPEGSVLLGRIAFDVARSRSGP